MFHKILNFGKNLWFLFFLISTEYGDSLCKSPYSLTENITYQKKNPNSDNFQLVMKSAKASDLMYRYCFQ